MNISNTRLKTIFENMNHARVAVLGDLMLDVYISGSATRLSQEAPVPVLRVRKQETRLGGAANVMHNLSSLAPECKIYAFGIAGKDEQGQELIRLLEKDGIDASGVYVDPKRCTTVKQRVIVSGQQVVRMDHEDTDPLSETIRTRIMKKIISSIEKKKFDAIILEDYAKGFLHAEMLQPIVDAARKNGVYVSLDPHPGHPMQIRNLSLMTPNRMEAFGLAGIYCTDPADRVENDKSLKQVAAVLRKSWNPDSLLVTLGHQGMALFRARKEMLAIPTHAREVFDVSGAGDTVISTYTLCRAAGAEETEAAQIANHAAGVVVGKQGTATTNYAEVAASFQE